ncbi:MAG: shikimate kinase AroK [Gammaproteobacteria bacterium]|nr:shikimate kinase AroK [Gammaproteobacteria bacterium]
MTRRNIFLIGPMGAGKTTAGKELAKTLGMVFVDSDHEIEQHTGANIPLIFELEGETGFRTRERSMIGELTQRENIVLATGGGAVLDKDNRAHLSSRGYVVYLRANIEQLFNRTSKDPHRPLLKTADPKAKLRELMETRAPLYEEIADLILDTDGHTPKWLVKKIIAARPS